MCVCVCGWVGGGGGGRGKRAAGWMGGQGGAAAADLTEILLPLGGLSAPEVPLLQKLGARLRQQVLCSLFADG
jgi:hypothetical protein